MALRLNQVTIIVKDFEVYKTFFVNMGLTLIVDAPPRYARFSCPGNFATFSIEKTDDAKRMEENQSQLFFELDSKEELDRYCDTLEQKGFQFREKPTDRDYLWREALLQTPENHDIRIYFAGKNRLDPPWKVKTEMEQLPESKKTKESNV